MITKNQNAKTRSLNVTLNRWNKLYSDKKTLARWIALYEAINIIGERAEERKEEMEELDISHKSIMDYINATEGNLLRRILLEENKIDVCFDGGTNTIN
jgi:arsenate reductase-like glutaredoxin family protein